MAKKKAGARRKTAQNKTNDPAPANTKGKWNSARPPNKAIGEVAPSKDIEGRSGEFPVVGIGASAGGLAALRTFFTQVPEDSGLAFVIVVHLSPDRESHMSELLQPHIKMPVQQVTETVPLEPNRVYVIPPNANLDTIDTHLRLTELEQRRIERAPIDHFFRTLAKTHDGEAIGVVLTGTGSDGTLGLREIKAKGGLTIVQDPADAEYDGMPQSAIATGLVDLILPLAKIPQAILEYADTQPKVPLVENEQDLKATERQLLHKIFAQIRARTGRDFSRYKRSTVLRRIQRRMQICRIDELGKYVEHLRKQSGEVHLLAEDMLITVTNFFRDPEVFEILEKRVIPQLFENKGTDETIRVWSVGCATGEEAYSLAILLLEEAARRGESPAIQVFASDLHERSLKTGREAFYPGDIETDVSPERLKRFFEKKDGGYQIRKAVRELVVFSPHNLLADPPFSRLDLVTCRNLLIYLQRDVQRDVIELFHYALRPEGFLVLGTAETLEASDLFQIADKKCCLYRKRNVPVPEPRLPVFPVTRARVPGEIEEADDVGKPVAPGALHHRLVEQFAPPSLLVGPDDKVVHVSEHAGRFLNVPGGELTANVHRLVREELRIELRSALLDARKDGRLTSSKPILVKFNGESGHVVLHVRPSQEPQQKGFALVIFEERPVGAAGEQTLSRLPAPARQPPQGEREQELDAELHRTQQHLQDSMEGFEASQEELKASNEELQSANEELRSTLEELETSKEELQSMNEELQTVNQENRHKVEELAQLSSDLQNLMAATEIATLFLDRNQRILRFTPKVGELFSIRPVDRGRPLSDFTHKLGYPRLESDVAKVLKQLIPIEREVQDKAGCWYLSRVLPYRSNDDRIEGVVITFVDITSRVESEAALRQSEEHFRALVDASAQMVWTTDAEGRVVEDSPTSRTFTGQTFEEWKDWGWLKVIHPDDRSNAETGWRQAVETRQPLQNEFRVYHSPSKEYRWTTVRAVPLKADDGSIRGWIGMNIDITDQKRAEESLRKANEELEQRVAERTAELNRQNQRLRHLANQLCEAEERERSKLAKTLHDGMQQILVACKMHLTPDPSQGNNEHAKRVEELIDEALKVSRTLSYELSPPALRNLDLPGALGWLAGQFQSNHLFDVELNVSQNFPAVPDDLKAFLFSAVRGLLLNSVKYSHDHAAKVNLEFTEKPSPQVGIAVADAGDGFDPTRAEMEEAEQDLHGFGLLSIRERVTALGGTFQIDAAPGDGAKITLTLPVSSQKQLRSSTDSLRKIERTAVRPNVPKSTEGLLRILLVDDHPILRDGLRSLFDRQESCEVIGEAGDGVEALERTEELLPDVILMDVSMPRMNGIESTREIHRRHPEIPIIALSFHEESEMAEEMRQAGAAAYLRKGGDAEQLFQTIRKVCGKTQK